MVFYVTTRERLRTFKLENTALTLAVSQDGEPLLYAAAFKPIVPVWMLYLLGVFGALGDLFDYVKPVLDVYDARTGKHLRTVEGISHFPAGLVNP